jgi:hypothetical protein
VFLSLALVLVAVVAMPSVAAAQISAPAVSVVLAPGARVRVTTPATGRIVGTVVSAEDDSLRVALASGSSLAIPRSGFSGLELSTGTKGQGWRGAGIGLLVGAGIGGAVGLATYRRSECYDDPVEGFFCDLVNHTSRSVTVASDAAVGGLAGVIVGALLGQAAGREQWLPVTLAGMGVRVGLLVSR